MSSYQYTSEYLSIPRYLANAVKKHRGILSKKQIDELTAAHGQYWSSEYGIYSTNDPLAHSKTRKCELTVSSANFEEKNTGYFLLPGSNLYRQHKHRLSYRKYEMQYEFAEWLGRRFARWHLRTKKTLCVIGTKPSNDFWSFVSTTGVELCWDREFVDGFNQVMNDSVAGWEHPEYPARAITRGTSSIYLLASYAIPRRAPIYRMIDDVAGIEHLQKEMYAA